MLLSPQMLSIKALMRFLDRGFILRALMVLMLYSLVPFGECLLILAIAEYIDVYLLFAVVAATSLLGLLLSLRPITKVLATLHESIGEGYYPEEPFAMLAGTLLAAVLVLTPGFVTDALGLLLFVPFIRRMAGRLITRPMRNRLKELYEYIKVYEE